MQALGGRASLAFNAEPDIKEWADGVALNPSRIPPGEPLEGDLAVAEARFRNAIDAGLEAMGELAGLGFRDGGPGRHPALNDEELDESRAGPLGRKVGFRR